MKKRAMKKWIPKDTIYCGDCKWLKYMETRILHKNPNALEIIDKYMPGTTVQKCQHSDICESDCWTTSQTHCKVEVWRCEYMGLTDYEQDSLLWDGCKECGVHMPKDW